MQMRMLKRLQASIDSGDIQIINRTVEGDGDQVLELFKRPVEKVLCELMADTLTALHTQSCDGFPPSWPSG